MDRFGDLLDDEIDEDDRHCSDPLGDQTDPPEAEPVGTRCCQLLLSNAIMNPAPTAFAWSERSRRRDSNPNLPITRDARTRAHPPLTLDLRAPRGASLYPQHSWEELEGRFFDRLDHSVMLGTLGEKIHDNRFLRLLRNLLQAGYLED